MPDNNITYSYRNGKKVDLYKKTDEFVVRTTAAPELAGTDATATERVSPSSTRMRVSAGELESAMAASRTVAPTHHAYYQTQTDQSFDITDRILVTFKQAPLVSPVAPHNNGAFTNVGSADGTWSPWFGFGKVDAFKAVEKAVGTILSTLSVRIQSALINPNGVDTDKEMVTLKNNSGQAISLTGWKLVNQGNNRQTLAGTIPAGGQTVIRLDSDDITLRNTGGTLTLLDDQGVEKHRVSYTGQQVKKGIVTVF